MGLNLQKRIRSQGTLETGFIVNKQQLVNTEGKIYSLVQHCDLVAPIVLIEFSVLQNWSVIPSDAN